MGIVKEKQSNQETEDTNLIVLFQRSLKESIGSKVKVYDPGVIPSLHTFKIFDHKLRKSFQPSSRRAADKVGKLF